MLENKLHRASLALMSVRLLLGIILFFQGFAKIFTWTFSGVYEMAFKSYESLFPAFLLKGVMYYTSFVELVGGLLIFLGLFRKWAYGALISVLLIVSVGHGMKDGIWELHHVMFRGLLLFALIWYPLSSDRISLDHFIRERKSAQ